jgi:hypothetical protein
LAGGLVLTLLAASATVGGGVQPAKPSGELLDRPDEQRRNGVVDIALEDDAVDGDDLAGPLGMHATNTLPDS